MSSPEKNEPGATPGPKQGMLSLLPHKQHAHADYDGEMPTQLVLQSLNPPLSTIASNPITIKGKDHPYKTENYQAELSGTLTHSPRKHQKQKP